jgi:diguanylate cyclase (GGDEF)-like protein
MKIKHYLAILIMACLGLGYGMEALLFHYHQKTQQMIQLDHQYDLAVKDIDRLNNDTLQYIISIDLILGSDQNYLLPGALKMGRLILQQIKQQENTLLNQQYSLPLDQAQKLIEESNLLLEKSGALPYDQREEKLYAMLIKTDDISNTLVTLIEKTAEELYKTKEEHALETEKNITQAQKNSLIIRCIYGLFILLSWIWINQRITHPITTLIHNAKKIEHNEDLDIQHKGPTEVKFLSQQIETTAKKLLYQALHDPLTGLHNRREFSRKVQHYFSKDQDIVKQTKLYNNKTPVKKGRASVILKKAPDVQHPLCICLIDLDRFKAVNDNCGHAAGDELLMLASNEIKQAAGQASIVARLGGDEFGILFINTPKQDCTDKIDDILDRIRSIHFEKNGSIFRISASIGMTFVTDSSIDTGEWINTADAGCFVAKDCGRDNRQVMELNDDRLNTIRNDTKVYNDVIKALEENRFVLYHQKIIGLQADNDNENYFEILVRMISEEGDIVAPYYFIGIVERYDLVARLDQWVVSHTIEWLENHPNELATIDTCSINLSGKSLASKDMHIFLKELMQNTSVPAHKICFEITETAAVNDINQAKRLIKSLRSIGCRFALDDFGSGLSSFAYLRTLEVDIIKIDGSFVKHLEESDFDQVMVKNINELAKNVNMKTVAEFAQTEGIATILKEIGVDYAQGYHFHQPEPLPTIHPLHSIPSQYKTPPITQP